MIPTLDIVLPSSDALAPGDNQGDLPHRPTPESSGERFGDLIARVLSPDSKEVLTPADTGKSQTASTKGPVNFRTRQSPVAGAEIPVVKPFTLPSKSVKASAPSTGKSDPQTDKKASASSGAENQLNAAALNLQDSILQLIAALPNGAPLPIPAPGKASELANAMAAKAIPVQPNGMAIKFSNQNTPEATKLDLSVGTAKSASLQTAIDAANSKVSSETGKSMAAPPKADPEQKITTTTNSPLPKGSDSLNRPPPDALAPDKNLSPEPATGSLMASGVLPDGKSQLPHVESNADVIKMATDGGGISVAKLDTTMKNAGKMNKIAGSAGGIMPLTEKTGRNGVIAPGEAEKILPGNAIFTVSKKDLPVAGPPNPPHAQETGIIVNATSLADFKPAATSQIAAAAAVSADTGARALERTHEMVVLHATGFQNSNTDSMRVVIKPDSGTQLSLELRQHGDNVDAQAVLQRGDFNQLNQHWPELQQHLEERGIRLAPLTSQGNTASNGGHHPFQEQHPARQEPALNPAFSQLTAKNATIKNIEPAAIAGAVHRGWETWA